MSIMSGHISDNAVSRQHDVQDGNSEGSQGTIVTASTSSHPSKELDAKDHQALSTQQRVGYSRSVSEKSSHRPSSDSLDRQQGSIASNSSITSSRDDTQDSESQLRIRHWLDDIESGSASDVLKAWGSVSSTQPARTAAAADTVTNQPSPCAVSFQWHDVKPMLEESGLLTGVGAWLRLENTAS